MAINTAVGGTGTIVNTAYQFRLHTGGSYSNGNSLNANWESADGWGANAEIGSGLSESSGVFTFPCTGKWLITFQLSGYANNNSQYYGIQMRLSSDSGSNYSTAGACYTWTSSGQNNHFATFQDVLVRIANTSTYRMKFICDFNNGIKITRFFLYRIYNGRIGLKQHPFSQPIQIHPCNRRTLINFCCFLMYYGCQSNNFIWFQAKCFSFILTCIRPKSIILL